MKFDHRGGRLSGCNQRFSLSVKRHTLPPAFFKGAQSVRTSEFLKIFSRWQLCSNPNLPSIQHLSARARRVDSQGSTLGRDTYHRRLWVGVYMTAISTPSTLYRGLMATSMSLCGGSTPPSATISSVVYILSLNVVKRVYIHTILINHFQTSIQ